ncbi:PEP/pyruvate-binding domain-containing protein [Anaeromyxobacter oryzae]|uniref:Phosphoenolpyruvate synthase n=1 Tax=Anaeromyxobacter oryzae TaxID=2918170 RepID=A0ABM7WPA9_9BACT|nr:PEP/pyruvate-binding domain-containing protein [Anaeromyxobacter oryzae]BDG01288.1 phosphoenolpyruvate synthase [Anaeromyxobacter oryzae]
MAFLHRGAPPETTSLLGGKAARLGELGALGLPVPRWVCLPAEIGDAVLARARPELEVALAGLEGAPAAEAPFAAAAARIRAAVLAAGLPADGAAALDAALAGPLAAAPSLAVRSSAVGEDSGRDSFAGQLDSFLRVPRSEVPARVLEVIASAYGARALLYRRVRGLPLAGARVGVIVQEMVDAARAGVLFTANPTTGDRGEVVIAAGTGTGEGVAAGTAAADIVHAELGTGAVRRVARAGAAAILSDSDVARLVALGRRIAGTAGVPQDVEWAIDAAGALHLLQARPITAFAAGRETVLDSSNIAESYPGVTRPLTFSFVRPAYERTLRQASRAFGVPEATLARERAVHANLVALVDGRIYYAILGWYRLYQQLPGFAWALPAFEKALGLPPRLVAPAPPPRGLARLGRAAIVARTWVRLGSLLRGLDGEARVFEARLDAERARLAVVDLDALDAHDLLDELDRLQDRLAEPYAVALVNDFFTFQLHAVVERLLRRWGVPDAAAARDGLLVGIRGVASLEPLRSVAALARLAAATPAVRAVLESRRDDADAWTVLRDAPEAAAFRAACAAHVARWGDRTLEELKLETPSLAEAPGALVAAVRNALAAGADPATLGQGPRGERDAAEAAVARVLARHPLRRLVFRWAAGHWRRGVRRREALRLARASGFGMAKRVFRALGRRFAREGLLDDPSELLWLTVDEVDGAVRGHAVTRDLRALVSLRRREWGVYEGRVPPQRVVVHGIVAARAVEEALAPGGARSGVLRGTGCCPGRARAPVRVVREARSQPVLRGEVLVASTTDPGWIFLMVGASALVAERGNPLSHTAIIGRELGLPTVVGVPDATRLLADGELVEVDGAAGTVTRVAVSG